MKTTVLNDRHRRLGATLVEFAGWEMPLSYSGILAEVAAVRGAAGLFDVSHMGVIEVSGAYAREEMDRLVTRSMPGLPTGRARYTLLLNPQGGILDDLIIYGRGPELLWVVSNASNAPAVAQWVEDRLGAGTTLARRFGEIAILALQGPRALAIAAGVFGCDFAGLSRFGSTLCTLEGAEVLASRTGYTGEDGLEFFCPVAAAPALWDRLLDAGKDDGLLPCGLGARDVLRIEAGNVLYGHEIDQDTSPVEANLMWAVDLEKGDFIGRAAVAALAQSGPARTLTGLVMEERAIPRQGAPIGLDEAPLGSVTSGTFSPTLNQGIAMGYLPPSEAAPGRPAWVDLRGKRRQARLAALPFVKRH